MIAKAKRALAIDFGLARIGLAISDPMKIFASPLDNLKGSKDLLWAAKTVAEKIGLLEEQYKCEIDEIVLGLPLKMNGEDSETTAMVRKFSEILQLLLNKQIVLLDERLSSVQAERALMETNMSRKKRAGLVDRVASVILLQTYLNQRKIGE